MNLSTVISYQVRDRIDRIARPFMEEHSLPVDETLLGHIEVRYPRRIQWID